MSINQNIRFSDPNPNSTSNPESLYGYLVAPQYITGTGAPPANIGTLNSVYVDMVSGIEYVMDRTGTWNPYVNFGSFAPSVPDPLSLHQLNVNTIDGFTSQNVTIDLGTTGDLFVGPTGAQHQVTIGSDGTIITDCSTSAVIVADGLGNQVTVQPQAITGTNALAITAVNAAGLSSIGSDSTLYGGANAIINGVSTVKLQVNGALNLQCGSGHIQGIVPFQGGFNGSPQYVGNSDTTGMECTGIAVKLYEGGVVRSTISGTSVTNTVPILQPYGTVGAPAYSWSGDPTTGIYGASGEIEFSVAGTNVLTLSSVSAIIANSGLDVNGTILPLANGVFNLGSASFQWNNIYAVNPLIVSDERAKKNISTMDHKLGLDLVNKLRPVVYNMKTEDDTAPLKIGLVAQEVDKHMAGYKRAYDVVRNEDDHLLLSYNALIPCLIKCVQQLSERLEQLEKKV